MNVIFLLLGVFLVFIVSLIKFSPINELVHYDLISKRHYQIYAHIFILFMTIFTLITTVILIKNMDVYFIVLKPIQIQTPETVFSLFDRSFSRIFGFGAGDVNRAYIFLGLAFTMFMMNVRYFYNTLYTHGFVELMRHLYYDTYINTKPLILKSCIYLLQLITILYVCPLLYQTNPRIILVALIVSFSDILVGWIICQN